MANCIYCGRPAGLFRRQHDDCRERHQSASQLIPGFIDRYLTNPIPVARFSELLLTAATQSFINKQTLKASVVSALTRFFNATLEQRLVNEQEQQRIIELLQALGIPMEGELFALIAKAEILRELQQGKIPDRVELMDPLPVDLRQDERVLWVFNRVESKRNKAADDDDGHANTRLPAELPYIPRSAAKWESAPKKLLFETTGDLIVTNFNLFLISSELSPRRIRFFHIDHLEPYSNALGIVSLKDKNDKRLKVGRIIILDDSWFAANLISSLISVTRFAQAPQIDLQSR